MSRKWKQINKFVEVFASALRASHLLDVDPTAKAARRPVRVVDFGAGKGYLTFAVHDHLLHQPGVDAQVAGVELRPDMVRLGNAVVAQLGLAGLRFEEGDVRSRAVQPIDVMIALHACDTATDHAIHLGLRGGASIILCSPCCHKELRPQLLSPHPLRPILQHGVHLGQQAEMLTDGLRAMLLDACGYDTQVFEFVALEHTQKNKMILAVKRTQLQSADAVWGQIDDIKAFYGIRDQCLETLLRAEGVLPAKGNPSHLQGAQ
jgi:SAM-dependent methyltransferase